MSDNLLKKGIYLGLGVVSLTKDKLAAVAAEVAKTAKLSEAEGRKFASELETESEKAREQLKAQVDGLVEAAAKHLPCCQKLTAIEHRLAKLEAAISKQAETAADAAADEAEPVAHAHHKK